MFFDRALGLAVLLVLAAIAALARVDWVLSDTLLSSIAVGVWIGFAALVVGVFAFYSEWTRSRPMVQAVLRRLPFQGALGKLSDVVYIYKRYPRCIAASVVVSAGIHLGVVAVHYFLFLALSDTSPGVGELLVLVPLSQIAMAIPLTPGSLGTAEAAYSTLFEKVGARDRKRSLYFVSSPSLRVGVGRMRALPRFATRSSV